MRRAGLVLAIVCGWLVVALGQTPSPATGVTINAPAVDLTGPTVTIVSPQASGTYSNGSSSSLAVSGTASDARVVSSCTYSNSLGGSGTLTGTTGWSGTVTGLSSGSNVLTFRCLDDIGNVGTSVLTVTVSGGVTPTWFQSFNVNCGEQDQVNTSSWKFGSNNQGNGADIQCDGSPADVVTLQRNGNWCTEGTNRNTIDPCLTAADLATGAHAEQITTAANRSSGAGGRGQRHWIGHTWHSQNTSGSIFYNLRTAVPAPAFQIRWYARWATGLNLGGQDGATANHKVLYAAGGNCNNGGTGCYWDLTPSNHHLVHGTTDPAGACTGAGFDNTAMFGATGGVADGRWIMFELYWQAPSAAGNDGEIRFAIEGTEMCHLTGLRFNSPASPPSTGFTGFSFPSNHGYTVPGGNGPYQPGGLIYPAAGTAECGCPQFDLPYDLDDIAIKIGTFTGYIGAFSAARATATFPDGF